MRTEKSLFKKISLMAGVLVYLFTGIVFAANAQLIELFSEVSDKDKLILLDETFSIRSRLVELNAGPLCVLKTAGQKNDTSWVPVNLNLFDDVYLRADIREIKKTFSGGYSYVGTVEGEPGSEVKLVLFGDILIGNIYVPGHFYQVRFVADGLFKVQEVNQSDFPSELPPIPVNTASRDHYPNLPDTADNVDVMVVYTAAASTAAGGPTAMKTLIDLAIVESNEGLNNSDVNFRFSLVHTAQVNYNESGFNWDTTLYRLQLPSDTYMDGVHQLRDTYGADVVVLIVENKEYCGIAFLMQSSSGDFEAWAFSVVNWKCATDYYSFAHEIGHNMGSHHDRANAEGSGFYPYSYGYQAPDSSFRTIMAYDCEPSCLRVNYWSNPQKQYSGQPMGVDSSSPLAADNHQSLNNTAFTVANFRQQTITPVITITSPNGGESWPAGSIQNITWTSSGVSGNVKIEYSSNNGANWKPVTASTSNPGIYSWTIPDVDSSLCLVRIQATGSGIPSDVSDSVFSIYKSGSSPSIHINQIRLDFTVIVTGYQTGSQQIWLNNSGGGILNWSINKDAAWLNCSPISGTNGGVVTVSVNPSGLGTGNYMGSIMVSDTGASNSPQTVVVGLSVKGGANDVPPFGSFDTPVDGSTVMSSIPVTGWVLDDVEVKSVKIFNGNSFVGDAVFVDGARPDVELAFPGYPKNYRAGWGYMLLTYFLPNGGNGSYTLYAKASDGRGQETVLGSTIINVKNINAVKPFGAIDTPAQGGYVQGNSFVNWGWVLTPQPNSIPLDGSTINVLVDGINLGHPEYNHYRKDIASLFPGYANSNGAVGYFYLDTTTLENGMHTIQWTATDSAGNTDGIGSRYFTVNNTGSDMSQSSAVAGQGRFKDLSEILSALSDTSTPILYKKGYQEKGNLKKELPSRDGIFRIHIRELEPLVVYLTGYTNENISPRVSKQSSITNVTNCFEGYMVVGNQLRAFPAGCFLDTKRGIFYWYPGPGILGRYMFIFIKKNKNEVFIKTRINIKVSPKFNISER